MANVEYEYSFKVDSLEPYISYCKKNKYIKKQECKETRILYKNNNQTMARITIKEQDGITTKLLDFKDDDMSDNVLIQRRESLPVRIETIEEAESIIDFLNYEFFKKLDRTRVVYEKEDVIFELDNYYLPDAMKVVGIEGNKKQVDAVYQEVKQIYK